MEQTPQAFLQTTFEPTGRVCAAKHARGGVGLQGKWRTRTYRTSPTYGLQLSIFPASPLIPTAALSSLPWERVRERATSRKACIGADKVLRKDCRQNALSPALPHRGREQVAADSGVAGRLKKNARNINGRNFSGSLYRKADGANAASVFSDGL